jgi:hypothetical protein
MRTDALGASTLSFCRDYFAGEYMFYIAAREVVLPVAILLATGTTVVVAIKNFLKDPARPQDNGKRAALPEHHYDIH